MTDGVLEEPPMDRVPIQTYVMEYNEELVREAIDEIFRREKEKQQKNEAE